MSDIIFNTAPPKWYELSNNIDVLHIGRIRATNRHPPRTLSEWALILVTSGERTFSICGQNFMVHCNEFFLLPPNIPHDGVKIDYHEACYVHFQTCGTEIPTPTRIASDKILLPMHGQIPVDRHCIDIMDFALQHRTPPFYSEPFCASQITAILYQLSIHMQRKTLWTKQNNANASAIMKFIDDNLDKQLCDQDYSQAFKKSYRQLNNVFSRVYGITIKQMQLNLRISRAKTLLSLGYSIEKTCEQCGFGDYFYFLKTFKFKTGYTPSEYVNQLNNAGKK